MPPFKDEHILIIAPGSQTTLAQLGLPESFTPARFRCPTRMFPTERDGEWEPHKVRERPRAHLTNGVHVKQDVEMHDAPNNEDEKPTSTEEEESEVSYEEDLASDEGAVWPIREGRIVDWSCFFALLTHVYNTLSPPFHTPVLVISQPIWSAKDHETLTQFFFQQFKIPAFCLMDSSLAACYAYGVQSATVVDIGHGKCDVTAVSEFVVHEIGRGMAIAGCGGDGMTRRLLQSLAPKGFTYQMCEQLKKSPVCEILPPGTELPGSTHTEEQTEVTNPAAAASTGASGSGPDRRESITSSMPRGPGLGTEVGEETNGNEEDNEGVIDIATIVARGNTSEFLAKREKEKAEKAAAKRSSVAEAAKPTRLPNSKKETATFQFEDYGIFESGEIGNGAGPTKKRKREVEVGVERFMAAAPTATINSDDRSGNSIIDTIASTIHSTIMAVPEVSKRGELWDSLVILGNGSKVRGFVPSLLSVLSSKYMVAPSSATIFTSEIPSALSTPLPTGGTNTPAQPPGTLPPAMHHPAAHGVNPLLVAATHANNPATNAQSLSSASLQVPGGSEMNQTGVHRGSGGHGQSPTSIKVLKSPEYFPEWKEPGVSGMEEAVFLGAQVAAKVIFVVDQGLSKGFLTRMEYNELGPMGIHEYSL